MKVRIVSLITPIIIVIALIIGVVYFLNDKQVERSAAGYQYKEKLFIEDEVGEINIEVSDENWKTILDNPTAEEYVEANVTVNGETYENVGIRAKGNSSLSSVASSDSNRYSLKVDFGQYNSAQTFYGLDKINLNNNFSDSTQMKDFVSYELMEQMGITTPAHSYVKVTLNGEYYGLMLAVEEIGSAFAQTNFGSTDGYIFKPEDTGSDLAYVSDDTEEYSGVFAGAKMNEKTAEESSNIINMMKEISVGDTSSLDVDQVAKYFALNTAMVNMDSYQGSFHHNYYLYEDSNGKFSMIPWDYNMSFGGFTGMGGGAGQPGQMGANQQATDTTQPAATGDKTNTQQVPANGEQGNTNVAEGQVVNGNVDMQPPTTNDNTQATDKNVVQNFDGQPGGGIMGGSSMITDTNVNFSITEPVSGTTVDARPLLKIILEDEEARALYNGYLEQFSTEFLTEENIDSITTRLGALLEDYVDDDPSKFFTTEDFLAGVDGEESIGAFAALRSESILKQLAGEIEGVSGASEGNDFMNGEMPDMGNMPGNGEMPDMGEMPGNGEMPDMGNMPGNGEMPDMGEMPGQPPTNGVGQGNTEVTDKTKGDVASDEQATDSQEASDNDTEKSTQENAQIPGNFQGGNGERPNMGEMNGNMGGPNGQTAEQSATVSKETLWLTGSSLVILVLALFGVNFLSNRKYRRK